MPDRGGARDVLRRDNKKLSRLLYVLFVLDHLREQSALLGEDLFSSHVQA